MRWKYESTNPRAFRCCFCCHVRTGTIFLGFLSLLTELISLVGFAILLLHPEVLKVYDTILIDPDVAVGGEEFNASYLSFNWVRPDQATSEDQFFTLLLLGGMITITSMLIYGAVKGRQGYLMPFFCIQVFQFCVTCLTGVGYFSYIPDLKQWLQLHADIPCKDELLAMDNDWLMLMFVLVFALLLLLQAYLIGMVWACYQFLMQYERNLTQGTMPIRMYPNTADRPEDVEMLLPPKYEDAIQQSLEETPPPPYST